MDLKSKCDSWRQLLLAVCLLLPSMAAVLAHDSNAFFESRIRPLLSQHCYECHSTGKQQKGGLLLDSKLGWQKGGDSGPALIPSRPNDSLLFNAVHWSEQEGRPPEKVRVKLSETEIADLKNWIEHGAFDPRISPPDLKVRGNWDQVFAQRQNWWSLLPVRRLRPSRSLSTDKPPKIVDLYLQDKMAKSGLIPSPRADAMTLLRRATLILTGLPPTAVDVEGFTLASRKNPVKAYSALVDRLLASPQFGERFTRHWLDVVRFTETHGSEWNYDVAYAWRYRDYLIRAFNGDLPYDQLVREHIAGDLLAKPRWNLTGHYNESAIGPAFYRFGEVNHDSCVTFRSIGYDIIDNQLDTLTKTFQATTVACARCHDHKLDAVSTKDYHALLGVLRSSRLVQQTLDAPEVNRDALIQLQRLKQEVRAELATVWQNEAPTVDVPKLQGLVADLKGKAPPINHPLHAWYGVTRPEVQNISEEWSKLGATRTGEAHLRSEFNRTNFATLADFRRELPKDWHTDGMGLRGGVSVHDDFLISLEGDSVLKGVLPSGLFTYALSDRLNGALRSPTLQRSKSKLSFEVQGGRYSLARIVFNNCQLNYNHQHSLHHNEWTWVTVDFPEKTDQLRPYAELVTFWDSPKFPDILGTLGKDSENLRGTFAEHSKNPRTWWGVRRIVQHNTVEKPREDLSPLARLFSQPTPSTQEEVASRYASIAKNVVASFAANRATDDDVQWLDWLVKNRLLSNRTNSTPRLTRLLTNYRSIEKQITSPTVIPGIADEGPGFTQAILQRGDSEKPGELAERGYLRALTPSGFKGDFQGSGRAEVAQIITRSDNPLTRRVLVNRAWQWVFGKGLVTTPDDFGHLGEAPSHPELLDYLASQFISDGWSIKKLIRTLVLSEAFQSANSPTEGARLHDPDNRLLSHYSARRAEAEVIRDSLLAVSGRLDPRLYGPSVHPYREKADTDKRLYTGPIDGYGRRSLYLKVQLMESPHFLGAFNLPGGKVTQGRRDASNVPAQSLAFLNDPFVLAMADLWAGLLLTERHRDTTERIEAMFKSGLGRPASPKEVNQFTQVLRTLAATHAVAETEILNNRTVWKDLAHTLFNLKEFIFIP